ncbi:MAG: TetR/AcrR family transcriptional regulator [Proteobacteria bacterium]|nr:TetR/AcrR family transcriptional regulator [Pseudomonadota bacterium]
MPSQKSSATIAARAPQRERGRARVAALLGAATAVFADKGYDAATMTEIAARAGASIGSLYQFFPTKELIAEALHAANADALVALLEALAPRLAGKPAEALADILFGEFSGFLAEHPAFVALADRRSIDPKRKKATRQKLRGEIVKLLAAAKPPVPRPRAQALAIVILHLLRVAVAIEGEADLEGRAAVLDEIRLMLGHHLSGR